MSSYTQPGGRGMLASSLRRFVKELPKYVVPREDGALQIRFNPVNRHACQPELMLLFRMVAQTLIEAYADYCDYTRRSTFYIASTDEECAECGERTIWQCARIWIFCTDLSEPMSIYAVAQATNESVDELRGIALEFEEACKRIRHPRVAA